jgi:hypothetical protein
MTTDEIKSLPIEQKIHLMEVLWEDLRGRFDRFDISGVHKKLLDERRERIRTGQAQLLNWDSVKSSIGRS